MVLLGVRLSFLDLPFMKQSLSLTNDVSVPLTVLLVVVLVNAVNFIDGLDGLAAGVVGIAALSPVHVQLCPGLAGPHPARPAGRADRRALRRGVSGLPAAQFQPGDAVHG